MKSIDFDLNTNLTEAVRMVKAKSYEIGERVVGEFNDFIIDSNKSEEDNIKAYRLEWNKEFVDGVDWEQRRYEIAKSVLPSVITKWVNVMMSLSYTYTKDNVIDDTMTFTDMLIEKLKDQSSNRTREAYCQIHDKARALTVSGGISNKMTVFHFIYFCEMNTFMVIM